MKNKMDQEYSFALRPASIEEAGLFYSNDEQDEALGTVGHLRLDFGHGFLPLRSTCYSCPATALSEIGIKQWGQLGEILGGVRFP